MRPFVVTSCVAALLLTACSETNSEQSATELVPTLRPAPTSPPAPPPPVPNYAEREGDTYHYVSAVSAEDRERGIATGNVVSFRFLGQDSQGRYRLARVGNGGNIVSRSSCSNPCRIIRYANGERTAFSASSIIGSAYVDAFNGLLEISSEARTSMDEPAANASGRAETPIIPPNSMQFVGIPVRFHGEWKTNLSACRSREEGFPSMYVFAHELRFYESRARINAIRSVNANTLVMTLDFVGEGQRWSEETTWRLSDNGQTIEESTTTYPETRIFHRC